MGPFTIDRHLIDTLDRYAQAGTRDEALLAHVRSEYPRASLKEIARAALYITTDPFPANPAIVKRLFDFAFELYNRPEERAST